MRIAPIAKAMCAAMALSLLGHTTFSQGFTSAEYKKALWMTTRMYGGQRSGPNNWLVYNHLPAGMDAKYKGLCFIEDKDTDGYDLSGGWHDCGDHVKFGQTEFYSAYMLLKAYAEFPRGYDDFYSADYKGYGTAGDWSWEGAKHDPNGIPDILDEVKHATDYFIKCSRNSSTFYYQVGEGDPDHMKWVTAVKMQTETKANGGQPRAAFKNPADASMPSFCGATLALMARLYKKFDPAYSAICLTHAKYAYDYAKAHPGTIGAAPFYTANDNWKDDYADMCAELYWATGTEAYKTEALSFSISYAPGQGTDIFGKSYGFDYTNNGDIAVYNLALLGKANGKTVFNDIIEKHYFANRQTDGQFSGGNTSWGPLRYNANTALMVALWQKLNGTTNTVHEYIYANIDYVLGKNSASQSFVVGFGNKSPKFPHHRNVYLRDDNPSDAVKRQMPIPTKNQQFGILLGGTRNPNTFVDDVVSYTYTEGGIDYNACLVGALAYINSVLAPVDTNKFGNPTPDLGATRSICGVTSLELDSKIGTDGKKTFEWLKDNVQIYAPSTARNKITITQAGKYTCRLDSVGKWSTEASVDILGVLPDIALGADKELCSPASYVLDMGVSGSGISYAWSVGGKVISTAKTITVYSAGTYKATVSASGCPSKSDEILITTKLPAVKHDTLCKAGQATLSVSGTGGPYEWYDVATTGTALATGSTYRPSVTSTKTFYVRDASSIAVTAGPSSTSNTLASGSNAGIIGFRFTATKAFTITQMKVLPIIYTCNSNDKVSVQFQLKQNGTTVATYTSDQPACTGVQSGSPFTTYYTLNFPTPITIASAGSYELIPSGGTQLVWFDNGANFTTMDAAGVIDITDDTRDDKATSFPGIFDIKIQAGSTCDRAPVFAVVDGTHPCNISNGWEEEMLENQLKVYPNPSADLFYLSTPLEVSIKVVDDLGREVMQVNSTVSLSFGRDWSPGLYHVVAFRQGQPIKTINIIKK